MPTTRFQFHATERRLQAGLVPQTLDHLTATLSATSVATNGTVPTLTWHAWRNAGGTQPYTLSLTPVFSGNNTAVATINSSTGAITLAGGTGSVTFTVAAGGKTVSITLTVTAVVTGTPGVWQGIQTISDSSQGVTISFPYQVFLPQTWTGSGTLWPVVTHLHGSVERGTDGTAQLTAFTPASGGVNLNAISGFPAIVVAPQFPSSFPLASSTVYLAAWHNMLATALPQLVASRYNGDTTKLSLMGISMGAENVYDTIHHYGGTFAAAAVLSGDLAPTTDYGGAATLAAAIPYLAAGPFASTPSHVYHSYDDGNIPVQHARDITSGLISAGAPCTYIEGPVGSGGHSYPYWNTITGSSAFWTWLTSQQLTYAWNSAAPLANALVADQPSDYASITAYRSNALSRYRGTLPAAITFDATNQYNGHPTVAAPLTSQFYAPLIIPSATSRTDVVYHVRRRMRGVEQNDTVIPVGQSRGVSGNGGTGQWSALLGMEFDPTTYYNNGGNGLTAYIKGIALEIYNGSDSTGPQYRLSAAVMSAGGSVLSDATSNTGVAATTCGDEWFDNAWYNYFLRVLRGTEAGTGKPCLFISVYYGPDGVAPKQIGTTLTLTMLDSSTPPMPSHAVLEPSLRNQANTSLLAPDTLGSLTAFQQLIDNAGHPNTAMDFTSVTAWGAHGYSHHGNGWAERAWDLARYNSDTAFKADNNKRFLLAVPTQMTWTAADGAHKSLPYLRYTWPAGGSGDIGVLDQTPQNTRPVTSDVWFREYFKPAPNFTTNGPNGGASTGYKMWQVGNASGGNVQRLEWTAESVGGGTVIGTSELYAYVPGNDTTVFDATLSDQETRKIQTNYPVNFGGAQITVRIGFGVMPEVDWIAPKGDGTDNRDGLTRVIYLHAKNYFDATLGTAGRWVRLWEMYLGFDADPAPYFHTGWAAVYNDGLTMGNLQYINNIDWGENRNQSSVYDTYIDRGIGGFVARDVEKFGADPFGVVAARASAAPKPIGSVTNTGNSGGTVTNAVKVYPLTTSLIPVIDGVDQSPVSVTAIEAQYTTVSVSHTGQASGTHTYNYKAKNANGTTSPTVSNVSVTV